MLQLSKIDRETRVSYSKEARHETDLVENLNAREGDTSRVVFLSTTHRRRLVYRIVRFEETRYEEVRVFIRAGCCPGSANFRRGKPTTIALDTLEQ